MAPDNRVSFRLPRAYIKRLEARATELEVDSRHEVAKQILQVALHAQETGLELLELLHAASHEMRDLRQDLSTALRLLFELAHHQRDEEVLLRVKDFTESRLS